MPGNRYLIEDKSTLFQNKLSKLTDSLGEGLVQGEFQTREEVIAEATRILETLYKTISDPTFVPPVILAGDNPDPSIYNKIWDDLIDDLSVIFSELENVEGHTIANFNFVQTEANRLTARLKNVSSKLGDYILYSSSATKDIIFFKDSFNDLSKVDVNSSLLNADECDVDQEEGVITLPVDTDKESTFEIRESPVINPNSNGVVGNNHQSGAKFNGDTKVILDLNPDSWFEYERVVAEAEDSKEALLLDMTINLGTERVVNYIRVNPNNFGTKTIIIIDAIETSLDGVTYTNVKDDIPIADFITEDEQNIFILAPSTSKYAGQGIYTFTPRKAKYVHFVFKQTEPYIIDTPDGDKLRYAIGLRDIDIRGFNFKPSGELISKEYQLTDDVRKVLLDVNQNPVKASELAKLKYFVSPDGGQSWFEIRPKAFTGFSGEESTVKEVLDFNGSEVDTIQTPVPVQSLRLKIVLTRNDPAFQEGSFTLRKTIEARSELHKVPADSPFEFTLEFAPVDGTLQIIDPLFGSRGMPDSTYLVGNGKGYTGSWVWQYYLPFNIFPRPWVKVATGNPAVYSLRQATAGEWLHILVGGHEWQSITKPMSEYTTDGSAQYNLYEFDQNRGILKFSASKSSNGNTSIGHYTNAPDRGVPITMYFEPERLYPSEIPDGHVAKLEFKTSSDKSALRIKRYDKLLTTTVIPPRKARVVELGHRGIEDTTHIATVLGTVGLTLHQDYVNGHDELVSSGWCIDEEHGKLYLGSETPTSRDISFHFTYRDYTQLGDTDWEWADSEDLRDSIKINESAWKTNDEEAFFLPTTSGINVLDLGHLGVVKGTVELTLLDGTSEVSSALDPFLREVPFVDGITEFGSVVTKAVEQIPALYPLAADVATFNLREKISSNIDDYIVSFSNTDVFITEDEALDTAGDYWVERDPSAPLYGQVSVKLSGPNSVYSPGFITYYYVTPRYKDLGLYSIDYPRGRIFSQRSLRGGTWALTANYQYSDYRAEYKIARHLPASTFSLGLDDKTITIKDEEILKHSTIPNDRDLGYYQVNYDRVLETRESITDLKDLFTPTLKDYVLKVITKSKLV